MGEPLPQQTLADLYDAHGAQLYRYATLILGDRAAAEDAVQEVFARMLSVDSAAVISFAYLATSVRNTCYSMMRHRRVRGARSGPLVESASTDASDEERLMVDQALRALPAEQREVVYLKIYEGLTFHEVAERCDISINTAGSRYRYAMQSLRTMLGRGTTA